MAVTHKHVVLNDTNAVAVSATGNHTGRDITIQNISDTAYVYIGGEGVSIGDYGYRLIPHAAWSVELRAGEVLYAVTSENDSEVAVIELGLEQVSHNG
jgi:hypothetical protein